MWVFALIGCTIPADQVLETVPFDEARPTEEAYDYPPIDLSDPADPGDTDTDTEPGGDPLTGPFARGKCLRLTGSPDRLTSGDFNLPTRANPRTLEMAVRTDGTGSESWVFSYGNLASSQAMYVGFIGSQPGVTQIGQSLTGTGITIDDDAWHHLAVTVTSAAEVTVYWDGEQVAAGSMTIDTRLGSGSVIGNALPNDGPKYFTGYVDELRVWSELRTAAQIRRSATRRVDASEPQLRMYFDFDDAAVVGNNAQIADATGNHSMTLVGDGDSPLTEPCP